MLKIRKVVVHRTSPMSISNGIVSLFYLCVVVKVALHAVRYDVSWAGAAVIVLVALLLAWGHFFLRIWALKATAAVAWIVAFLLLFYLIPGYDMTPVSTFPVRLTYSCVATLLAVLLSLNYWAILRKNHG